MSRKSLLIVLLLAAAAVVVIATVYFFNLPRTLAQHDTIVLGESRFPPGSQAALRVIVRDHRDARPLPNAAVKLSLQAAQDQPLVPLYEGQTDADGNADVSFRVPEDAAPDQQLIVETTSPLGSDRVAQPVKIERAYRILLTADKPIYQPGQVIHLRALALSTSGRTPAAQQAIEFVIADGKGNKVFRQTQTTSDYGVAAVDFQLAAEVNAGAYNLAAQIGDTSSEKTVDVRPYVLPKFAIELTTDRTFYQPGEAVRGSLSANYFFGKPVSGGQVVLEGYIFDVERAPFVTLKGATDARGNFDFNFELPSYIAGSDLEEGGGRFYLQASVTDQAQHTEVSNLSLPVAQQPIVIRAIPESGQFRPGVENILYVMTSTPDGAPVEAELSIELDNPEPTVAARTDGYGLAELRLTPDRYRNDMLITAKALNGGRASRQFQFRSDYYYAASNILLRPDKPIYAVGESMRLDIFAANAAGTVYLDIVRDGQTASTQAVPLGDGRAQVVVDLTPDLYGTLELHAYQVTSDNRLVRDTRLAVVNAATDLDVALQADREVYAPGDRAGLDIRVSGPDGSGAPAAIGLAIVDESVFALADQDPGFARLYFLLEQELLQPKYEVHGFSLGRTIDQPTGVDQSLRAAQQMAAAASLAEALVQRSAFSLAANTHDEITQRTYATQGSYFAVLNKGLFGLSIVLAGAIVWYGGVSLHRRKRLALSFVLVLIAGVIAYAVMRSQLYSLATLLYIGLALSIPIGLIVLVVLAARRKDRALRRAAVFIALYFLLVIAIVFTALFARTFSYDIEWLALPGAALVLLMFFMLLAGQVAGGCGTQAMTLLVVLALILPAGCAAAAPPGAQDFVSQPPEAAMQQTASAKAEPPRLRQFFPETLLWLPEAVTDADGQLHVDVPLADSITTWRMTALASTRDGRLGSTTGGLRVFQDFFIDLDLPAALTVGDEVAVPVGVFNYLPDRQTVRLEVSPADWFELLDEPIKSTTIAANDVGVIYFRIRAKAFGAQPFKVTAYGTQLSDAIQKTVQVKPDGKPFFVAQSDRLTPGSPIRQTVKFPAQTITGTQTINVKIYPGIISQVVEGLDSILRMPYGCFEQTSSTTYPNVLVLDYLRATNQASPEVQLKAEQYINLGYQRLTTFEVGGGGFSLFGRSPASQMLTAYGLQEFGDMRRVRDVDADLIQRAADWLLAQQQADGSWNVDPGLAHESTWGSLQNKQLPGTAYSLWSLIEAGFFDDARVQRGITYLRAHGEETDSAYVLALAANALVAADRAAAPEGAAFQIDASTRRVLERLAAMAVLDKGAATWPSGVATYTGAKGQTGDIETTALAALAFLRADDRPQLANAALTSIVQQKDNFGTWHSTQATILALKALLQSVRAGSENVDAAITVKLDDGQPRTVQVTRENFDVTQVLTFNDLPAGREHTAEISASGQGNLMYQIAGSYYLPWSAVPPATEQAEPLTIAVRYDRSELKINDSVRVNVRVRLSQPGSRAESALIDLGVPPGFAVQTDDLDQLVARYRDLPDGYAGARVERYELTGRQVLIYLTNLSGAQPVDLSYRLTARFPLVAQTPASAAYDYYNPDIAGEALPQRLTVNP
jgi:uncharacterized protein YfaS (alpha-2-macroglobulin family)